MSADSSLVKYVFWVKNYTKMTDKVNKKITIHHQAGALTPEKLAQIFNGSRKASAQYGISKDGIISQMVKESDRAWTSSSSWNDGQAVTIEVANSTGAPDWKISDASWNAMIDLCADICIRNGIIPKYTGDKNGTLTEHCMFSATACPGPYIHARMKQIESAILARMEEMQGAPVTPTQNVTPVENNGKSLWKVQAGAYSRKSNATALANKLKKNGIDAIVVQEGTFYKVQCGAFSNRLNALNMVSKVRMIVPDAYMKEYK